MKKVLVVVAVLSVFYGTAALSLGTASVQEAGQHKERIEEALQAATG